MGKAPSSDQWFCGYYHFIRFLRAFPSFLIFLFYRTHVIYGWGIPGRQVNFQSIYGIFDGQGYLFADDLLTVNTVVYEYYNYNNHLVKMIYTVISRDAEITTPAGNFTDCLEIHIREELSDIDAADSTYRDSFNDLCEYIRFYCPGVGLISESCTYINSPEQNAKHGGICLLKRYSIAEASPYIIPMEEGNEFEYIRIDAGGNSISDQMTYRDIYRVDTVTPDGVIYLANYGYGYYA